jgi:NAD(P)-dependent dehydrogenase (short-subunit alcohol dehydrogenase family)
MKISLKGRVIWVTGAGEGIGRAICLQAADCGAFVALTGLDESGLDEVLNEVRERGAEGLSLPGDITRSAKMQQAVERIRDKWGRLDVVCANAGINGTWAPIDELAPEEWRKTVDVNLTGTYLTLHHAVPLMKQSGGGSVVIVSSVNGTRMFSNEGASAYASSKAGQLALGKMLALELAPSRIRVNVICPGAIDTGIQEKTEERNLEKIETPVDYPEGNIPLTDGEMGQPDQVAQLAIFLASDAASHITGTPVWIDGAQSLLQG